MYSPASIRSGLPAAGFLLLALTASEGLLIPQQQEVRQQQPTFRSGVELVLVDVQVVDRQGNPIPNLRIEDFNVRIDRRPRKVVSIEAVRFGQESGEAAQRTSTAATPERIEEGRNLILAIDESSFSPGHAMAAREAAKQFVARLNPGDRVGLFRFPVYQSELVLSTDHQAALEQLDSVMGVLELPQGEFRLSLTDVFDVTSGDEDALRRISERECPQAPGPCRKRILIAAQSLALVFEGQVSQSVQGLRALLGALAGYEGRKTLVLVSGGLLAADRPGVRPDIRSIVDEVGRQAALANVTLYVLHMDNSFLDAFSPKGAGARASFMRDSRALGEGLERFAGTAGGALFTVYAGRGDSAFDRVLRETSAYYLLGVEPEPSDRDGQPHTISVSVRRRGAQVRSRSTVLIPRER